VLGPGRGPVGAARRRPGPHRQRVGAGVKYLLQHGLAVGPPLLLVQLSVMPEGLCVGIGAIWMNSVISKAGLLNFGSKGAQGIYAGTATRSFAVWTTPQHGALFAAGMPSSC
jgi:hypothetical protein